MKKAVSICKKYDTLVSLDGAQGLAHKNRPSNSGLDFVAFSSHKVFGPSGVGVLYIRDIHHAKLKHARTGGGMVNVFSKEKQLFKGMPLGFEPGTPAIEAIWGFGAALSYIAQLEHEEVSKHFEKLNKKFLEKLELSSFELAFNKDPMGLPIYSLKAKNKHLDLSSFSRLLSDQYNVVVNDGQHCCQPLLCIRKFTG